jgi:hypothetical protein
MQFAEDWWIQSESCLYPYRRLLNSLAKKVYEKRFEARKHKHFKTWFTMKDEDSYVDEFIREMLTEFGNIKRRIVDQNSVSKLVAAEGHNPNDRPT